MFKLFSHAMKIKLTKWFSNERGLSSSDGEKKRCATTKKVKIKLKEIQKNEYKSVNHPIARQKTKYT